MPRRLPASVKPATNGYAKGWAFPIGGVTMEEGRHARRWDVANSSQQWQFHIGYPAVTEATNRKGPQGPF